MTRIVGGSVGGRRLDVPSGTLTRPTSDRAREGLFSTLEALRGTLEGARVLDLYAGSGAVGLEAASRGARDVLLVDADTRAAQVIRANVAALGLSGVVVRRDRVERLLAAPPQHRYDIVVADPPYALPAEDLAAVLRELVRQRWVVRGGLVVLERASRSGDWEWPAGLEPVRSRRYGEAHLWYGRRS